MPPSMMLSIILTVSSNSLPRTTAIRCFSRILFKMLNFFIVFTPKWIFSCLHARKYRSEEHTSELQSRFDLVCRLLLEKKKETHKGDLYTLLNNGDQKR